MDLDLGKWICIVLLCCSVSLHLKRSMGDSGLRTRGQETCAALSTFLCYDLSLLHLKRASETQNHLLMDTQALRDRTSETCAYVIHTNLHTLSAACALLIFMFARGTCAL